MTEVYETEFKECIPLEADEAILERLGQIEQTILNAIHQWAKKADKDKSVRKLQLPSLPKVKEADNFEDDLLAAHNHNNRYAETFDSALSSLC
ncbi:MAG: acetoacetate--CoA ligase family protein [Cyanobacteria bacterium RM1_2_2]|nr:acetoacetate--CoA ligase family protein [Cyanobacteria bacterium RM1_2_2]